MKLNILSDLHLSCGRLEIPETDADVVILAGDIGRPAEAIKWARGFDKPVLYVPGNHEFYGSSLGATIAELKHLSAGTRIQVLERELLRIQGVRFLGTTLWTDFDLFGAGAAADEATTQAKVFMRDFQKIQTTAAPDDLFTPSDCATLCRGSAQWLAQALAQPFDGPTVVVTHHAPSPQSIHPRFAGSPLNACFVSDLEGLVRQSRAALWVHGHTHDSFDYRIDQTRVVCNPRGYAKDGVHENPAFDSCFVVNVALQE